MFAGRSRGRGPIRLTCSWFTEPATSCPGGCVPHLLHGPSFPGIPGKTDIGSGAGKPGGGPGGGAESQLRQGGPLPVRTFELHFHLEDCAPEMGLGQFWSLRGSACFSWRGEQSCLEPAKPGSAPCTHLMPKRPVGDVGWMRDSRLESSAGGQEEDGSVKPRVSSPFPTNMGPAHLSRGL